MNHLDQASVQRRRKLHSYRVEPCARLSEFECAKERYFKTLWCKGLIRSRAILRETIYAII